MNQTPSYDIDKPCYPCGGTGQGKDGYCKKCGGKGWVRIYVQGLWDAINSLDLEGSNHGIESEKTGTNPQAIETADVRRERRRQDHGSDSVP